MAQLLSEFDAPVARLTPGTLPSSTKLGCPSAAEHTTTLRGLRQSASAGRQDDVEVRYIAASRAPVLVVENASLVEELQASRLRIVEAAERERRRLEQDLHDGTQQRLVEIQAILGTARALVDRPDLARQLDAIQQAADDALDELRALVRGIYPATLRDFGPAAALRTLAQRSIVPIRVTDEGIGRASAAIEAAIYFCAREAIQNATKHAGAGARVDVRLRRRRGVIEVIISDDGVGMPDDVSDGVGIVGMRDRIGAVGGGLEIMSHRGLGTYIHAMIPDDEDRHLGGP